MKRKILFLALLLSLGITACRSAPQEKSSGPDRLDSSDNQSKPHLIADYAGMKESPYIASAWIDSNFTLEDCSEIRIQPVLNYSTMNYPQAQDRLEQALESLVPEAKNPSGKSVLVTAAITGMHGKPGFIKRFSPSYEDKPAIELELVISEARSGRELVKLCHLERGDETAQAVDQLINALTLFFKKKL